MKPGCKPLTQPRAPEEPPEPWGKYQEYHPKAEAAEFVMYLNDGLVAKRFGTRPWLGRRMRLITKNVICGVAWSLPKKDYVPDTMVVEAVIALTPLAKGKWKVSVAKEFRRYAEEYLLENCMFVPPKKRRKTRRRA